jgi:hypothetical protein
VSVAPQFSRLAVIAGCLLIVAGTARLQNARLELEPWVGAGSCQLAEVTAPVTPRGRSIEFDCASPDKAIRCNFDGAEPLDTTVGQVCRTKRLTLQPGRAVQLEGLRADAIVDWLDTAWNRAPIVLATRSGSLARINVHAVPSRALRVRRPGAAPLTLFPVASTTGEIGVLKIPRPAPGGELLIGHEPTAVRPDSLNISQQTTVATVPLKPARLAAATLPPGDYEITPVFAGGIHGDRLRARVAEGESSFVSLAGADVGALQLKVSDDLCVEAPRAVVSRVEKSGTRSSSRQVAAVGLAAQGCQPVIAGLSPGAYEVELSSAATGLNVRETSEVTRQMVTVVSLAAPVVRVFGRVTVSKKPPAAGARLILQPANVVDPDRATPVTLRQDGTFEGRVQAPGAYVASIQTGSVAGIGVSREIVLKEGYNELNWDIEAGSLKVSLTNWDRSSPVTLTLRRVVDTKTPMTPRPGTTVEVTSRIAVKDELPVTISALEIADYVVAARQSIRGGLARVSSPVTVSLTSAQLADEVELALFAYESVIRVIDGGGRPVNGAQVRTVEGPVRELEPGVFPITGQHGNPGTPIQIKASGYMSMCRSAPPTEVAATVIMSAGSPAVLRYLGRDDVNQPVGEVMPPGSDCWVALTEFAHSVVKVGATQLDVTVQNWPGGAVPFRLSPRFPATTVSVGSDGIAVVQLPGR